MNLPWTVTMSSHSNQHYTNRRNTGETDIPQLGFCRLFLIRITLIVKLSTVVFKTEFNKNLQTIHRLLKDQRLQYLSLGL